MGQINYVISLAGAVAKYCNKYVCLCVCLFVCLSVCLRGYLRNHTRDLYQMFCACCLWPWFGKLRQVDEIPMGRGNSVANVPDKPDTPNNCELDWSMQRRAHVRGRRLIASVGRV